jgi:DNA-binding transcriptional regulator PaaX
MGKNDTTSAIIDGILRISVTSSAIAAGLLIPNLMIGLEKPLNVFWKRLDKRERERELRRIVSYMKSNHLLKGNYEHGLQITDKGRERLSQSDFDSLNIQQPRNWDGNWRLMIYDIPEKQRVGRRALTAKLSELGFYQLQRSAWLHPFPCRDIIEVITSRYRIDKYISYIQTPHIDNQKVLIQKFKKKYPLTNFK